MFEGIRERIKQYRIRHASFQDRVIMLRKLGVTIGNGCEIYPEAVWGSEPYLIRIGNNVRITNGVKFVTHDGGLWTLRRMGLVDENACFYEPISIGDNTHIGWDTIIMPGVQIGKNCIIGCGAVVTKSIPDNSIAVGVPARVIKNIQEYAEQHQESSVNVLQLSLKDREKYLRELFADK